MSLHDALNYHEQVMLLSMCLSRTHNVALNMCMNRHEMLNVDYESYHELVMLLWMCLSRTHNVAQNMYVNQH